MKAIQRQHNIDRWVIEIYKRMIDALQSVAWMLLIFFFFALMAYVVIRGCELNKSTGQKGNDS